MRLIFLNPIFNHAALRVHDVASHAANAWMVGITRALTARGVAVRLMGHEPARLWPRGRHLLPGKFEHLQEGVPQRLVSYVNMPLLRHFSLCGGYRQALCSELRDWSDAFVCTYNPLPWQVFAAKAAVGKGARWLSFVLDEDTVTLHGWDAYLRKTEGAVGHVFVSQWAYEHAPVAHKLLLEGGVDAWKGEEAERLSDVPSVMYAGLLSEASGIRELLALVDSMREARVEFWICGKGVNAELAERAKRDQRIKLLGFLSEAELHQRLKSAWVLVNPRSVVHEGSRMNFPSKLLRYLSYGKPIITVWTPGLSAGYRKVLQVVDPEVYGTSADALGREMGKRVGAVLTWSAAERRAWQQVIQRFLVPDKMWPEQIGRLVNFMEGLDA